MRARTVRITAAMGAITVADKLAAAGRHIFLAALFGAGAVMDSLVIGVSVAELLAALFTGSFLVIFIPLYSGWREKEGTGVADARGLNLMMMLLAVLGVAAAGLAWGGGRVVGWVGYGFTAEQKVTAASLMPWLAIFLWATGAAVLVTGLYRVRGRFLAPHLAQLVDRLVVLAFIVVAAPLLGIRGVAMAMAAGAVVLAGVLVAGAWHRRGRPQARLAPRSPEVKAYLILFLPLLAAAVIDQSVLFTDRIMATMLPAGAVSALYYASVLWGLPVVLLCTNFCTVLFPAMARDVAAGDTAALAQSLAFGLRSMLVVMLGATVLMVVLARDLTAVLLMRGEFDAHAAALTGGALAALSLCLVFQGVGSVVNMALYAAHRTGIVAACGIGRVVLNIIFNLLLVGPLGAVGIALSTSLTLAAWLAIIWTPFRREMATRGVPAVLGSHSGLFLVKTGAAAALAAAATLAVTLAIPGSALPERLARLAGAAFAGTTIYAMGLTIFRVPEAMAVLRRVRGRLWPGRAGL
ncbi:MAG: polysaccharide biosynthesis C-terminal domain-containing protein [Acidobacteria bacterium]|nr:polysaccharide biosynthesis C-terminal domain-containing protein [Acidobacteriota bacterium]